MFAEILAMKLKSLTEYYQNGAGGFCEKQTFLQYRFFFLNVMSKVSLLKSPFASVNLDLEKAWNHWNGIIRNQLFCK